MRKIFAVMALSLLAANVMAAVSPEEAAKLGTTLTPVGAEKAATPTAQFPPGPAAFRKTPVRWTARVSWPIHLPVKSRCS